MQKLKSINLKNNLATVKSIWETFNIVNERISDKEPKTPRKNT